MLLNDLPALISQGEGAKLEFKRDDIRPEQMAKEIVAFANMNGGVILVGVDDDGSICGVQKNNLQEWLMDTVIDRYVEPFILPDYDELSADGKKVAVITIPQGVAKPYVVTHNERQDIYVRYGNTCQIAKREQIARLFDSGGLLSAEKFPVHGSTLADLDQRRYEEYCYKILGYERNAGDINELLRSFGFIRDDVEPPCCSYLAYALFAKTPQYRLPQAGIRLTVYEGVEKDYHTTFDQIYNNPLSPYIGDIARAGNPIELPLHEYIALKQYVSREKLVGTVRQREWDYPPESIRELIINALIHRDWTKQDYVRVVVYKDRLEISSPGGLPNGMTVAKIKNGVVVQRNPIIARVFRDYGYLEQQGMGIRRKVIPLMLEHNGREPDFEAADDFFKVTLWKKMNKQ